MTRQDLIAFATAWLQAHVNEEEQAFLESVRHLAHYEQPDFDESHDP